MTLNKISQALILSGAVFLVHVLINKQPLLKLSLLQSKQSKVLNKTTHNLSMQRKAV
jgi:hypothetical protein